VGSGVQISNVKFTGVNVAAGRFSGGANSIGFDQGVILSTGQAKDVIGIASQFASTNNNQPGDTDLDTLTANPTLDAAVLEFDFVPEGSVLNFQYVFGSEEYPEFVNASVNDVFGFFLNGKNVALIPGTNTPISIDTVNASTNSQFYVDNTNNTFAVSLDAFTKVLTVTANVTIGQSNHIKLAISDAGDHIFDSDVFIKAGSFTSPKKPVPVLKVYNPVRFIYNPKTKTYDGMFTVINVGTGPATGPSYLIFKKLPAGASIYNGAGGSGATFVTITGTIPAKHSIHVLVKIRNPLHKPLDHFYFNANIGFSSSKPA
jgi:hypothetical protein